MNRRLLEIILLRRKEKKKEICILIDGIIYLFFFFFFLHAAAYSTSWYSKMRVVYLDWITCSTNWKIISIVSSARFPDSTRRGNKELHKGTNCEELRNTCICPRQIEEWVETNDSPFSRGKCGSFTRNAWNRRWKSQIHCVYRDFDGLPRIDAPERCELKYDMRRFIRLPKSRNDTFNSTNFDHDRKNKSGGDLVFPFFSFSKFSSTFEISKLRRSEKLLLKNFFVSIRYLFLRESIELISLLKFSPNSTMRVTDPQQVDNRALRNKYTRTREISKRTPIYKIRMTQMRVATSLLLFRFFR